MRQAYRITLLAMLTIGMTGAVRAQDDPFAMIDDAASPPVSTSPAEDAAPAIPMAPGAAAPTTTNDDPFATGTSAPIDFQPSFGAPPAGTAATTPEDNPFADTNPGSFETPAEAPGAAAPMGFGEAPAPTNGPVSPFGQQAGATTTAAPSGTGRGIAQLFDFRYVEVSNVLGKTTVIRKQMTKEEAEVFDTTVKNYYAGLARDGKLPNSTFSAGVDNADEWASWLLYSNQLELWARYCRDIPLAGGQVEFDPKADIIWPGDPRGTEIGGQGAAALQGGGEKDGGSTRPRNIYNENRSLDEQLTDFVPVADTRQNGQGRTVIDPKQMDDQAKKIYDNFLDKLREVERTQHTFALNLQRDIEDRARRRDEYAEWRQNQTRIIMDYVEEWSRRYDNKIVTVAGVRYELYKPGSVPTNTTRFANIVVTDYDLTPYDLLNEDGSLRGPSK